ncbi:MAG: HAMP domain-containing histidine kinase [Chloroflexi bacterium]|nr:HAMP domain-containing histidine kinase [Chloroflexota bacterium]
MGSLSVRASLLLALFVAGVGLLGVNLALGDRAPATLADLALQRQLDAARVTAEAIGMALADEERAISQIAASPSISASATSSLQPALDSALIARPRLRALGVLSQPSPGEAGRFVAIAGDPAVLPADAVSAAVRQPLPAGRRAVTISLGRSREGGPIAVPPIAVLAPLGSTGRWLVGALADAPLVALGEAVAGTKGDGVSWYVLTSDRTLILTSSGAAGPIDGGGGTAPRAWIEGPTGQVAAVARLPGTDWVLLRQSPGWGELEAGRSAERTAQARTILSMAVGLAAVALLGLWTLRRLRILLKAAEVVPVVGEAAAQEEGDEIARAAAALARVADAYEHLEAEREAANREKARFADLISETIRQPLGRLRDDLGVAREGWERLPEARRWHYVISGHETVERLAHLVGNLMLIGQIDAETLALDKKMFDGLQLARNVVNAALNRYPGFSGRVEALGQIPPGYGDPLRIGQVLDQLLANAWQHGGGEATVVVGQRDGSVLYGVEDRGPGMTSAEADRALHSFGRKRNFSNEVGSVGLGLYLARRLTEAVGGELTYRVQKGAGCTFYIHLPRAPGKM